MTINKSSFLKRFGISLIAGALLLATSPAAPVSNKVSLDQVDHPIWIGDAILPSVFHIWSTQAVAVADVDPGIFHPWGGTTRALAELDPDIFHPWSRQAAAVADVDPDIFHPWGGTTRALAELDPDIFHPWG